MTNTLYIIFAALLMLPGIIGVFAPIIPGIPFMLVVSLLYSLIDRFRHLTGHEFALLCLITLISIVIDHLSGILGAKFGGASKKALLYGTFGMIMGFIILPPFGSFIGLFAGVLVGELYQRKNQKEAIKAATGSLIGVASGMIINFILALIFLGLFISFGLR